MIAAEELLGRRPRISPCLAKVVNFSDICRVSLHPTGTQARTAATPSQFLRKFQQLHPMPSRISRRRWTT